MIWTCTDHDGHYVGVASVVVANSEAAARTLLDQALIDVGLKPGGYTLAALDPEQPQAVILQDGNY